MSRRWIFAAAALWAASTGQIGAQDEGSLDPEAQIGSRFKQAAETAQESDARMMQKAIARCVVELNGKSVRTLVAHSDFRSIDFEAAQQEPDTLFDDLDVGFCMGKAMKDSQYRMLMRMPVATLRNLLAEEVYLRDNKVALVAQNGVSQLVERHKGRESMPVGTAMMSDLADCISFRAAGPAHDLLASRPGSKSEGAAFDALAPTLGACMEGQGEVTLQRSLLRQVVADGLWARSHSLVAGEVSK